MEYYGHPLDKGVVNHYNVVSRDTKLKRTYDKCKKCKIPISIQGNTEYGNNYCSYICMAIDKRECRVECPECNFKTCLVGRMKFHFEDEHTKSEAIWWQKVATCEVHFGYPKNTNKRTYGKGWNKSKREKVRKRDEYECQFCGTSQEEHREKYNTALHVHHIKPARKFDHPKERNSMDNLVTLCCVCHPKAENGKLGPISVTKNNNTKVIAD